MGCHRLLVLKKRGLLNNIFLQLNLIKKGVKAMNTQEKVWEEAKTDELVEGYKLYLDKDGEYNPKIYEAMAKVCNEKQELIIADHRPKYFSLEKMPEPTKEEINQARIAELKQKLAETDYAVIKIAEGEATQDDYAEVLAQRKDWRAEINELQA